MMIMTMMKGRKGEREREGEREGGGQTDRPTEGLKKQTDGDSIADRQKRNFPDSAFFAVWPLSGSAQRRMRQR